MTTATAIANRISSFVPKSLPRAQWELAAYVVRELVRAADPTTVEDAKCLLSTLCAYLATPCGWDRVSVPDLKPLLQDASIETFKARFVGPTKTRDNHVGRLRSLQRAQAGITRVAGRSRHRHQPVSAAVRRVHEVCAGQPVAVFAAVVDASTGRTATASRLNGLADELSRPTAGTATRRTPGIVSSDQMVLEPYLRTTDCDTQKGVVRATKPSRTTSTKPLSGRQQLANERAERAALRRLHDGPRLAPEPDPSTLPPAVQVAIEQYRPVDLTDKVWAALRPLTLRLVTGYRPASATAARNVASFVVPFLLWVWALPSREDPTAPPTAIELLASPLVELYASPRGSWLRTENVPSATVSSARTALRRAVRSLDADRQDTRFAYVPIDPPYSPAECDRFAWLAVNQPTTARERNACFLVGLCLGAGLAAGDLRLVRRKHVTSRVAPDGTEYLVVTVPGPNGRVVPVRRQYEDLLRRALELSSDEGPEALVLGKKATRRNVTYVASHGIVTARKDDLVDIQPHRLRTTWLFACINAAVPLGDVLRLAGLKSARSLADLLPLCPPTDPAVVDSLVAQVRDVAVHTVTKAVTA